MAPHTVNPAIIAKKKSTKAMIIANEITGCLIGLYEA
jgi:hypothetical protein